MKTDTSTHRSLLTSTERFKLISPFLTLRLPFDQGAYKFLMQEHLHLNRDRYQVTSIYCFLTEREQFLVPGRSLLTGLLFLSMFFCNSSLDVFIFYNYSNGKAKYFISHIWLFADDCVYYKRNCKPTRSSTLQHNVYTELKRPLSYASGMRLEFGVPLQESYVIGALKGIQSRAVTVYFFSLFIHNKWHLTESSHQT